MKRLRVGAVSYLNTKPLIARLAELAPEIDLILELPSRLAVDLAAGRLDIGLIPVIEYFRANGRYSIIPEVSISSFGPVMSVKLCSRKPFAELASVAVDEGSRTSIALMQVLLNQHFGINPATRPLPIRQPLVEVEADAVLVIGDRAMRVPDGAYPYTFDLGYEWSRWTGLPFVFAFWTVGEGVEVPADLVHAFRRAKELGRPEIPRIVDQESRRLGLDHTQCLYYLEHVIRHDFGPAELAGLRRFANEAAALHLAPEGVDCVFHGCEHLAASC